MYDSTDRWTDIRIYPDAHTGTVRVLKFEGLNFRGLKR